MQAMLDWDDYRLVLTVARTGTVAGAARRLGVNETTVGRRLAGIEAAAGATLFRRVDRRLAPSAAGTGVVAAAEAMERALREASQRNYTLSGVVRISTVVSVIEYLIAPNMPDFVETHPDLVLEFIGANETTSLARREADIAIRLDRPERGKLVARRLGRIRFCLAGLPEAGGRGYIGYESDLDHVPEMRAAAAYFGGNPVARMSTLTGIRTAAESGLGAAMLPDWIIAASDRLAVLDPSVAAERPLWLVVHEDLKDRPAVRAAMNWLSRTVTGTPTAAAQAPAETGAETTLAREAAG